MINRADANLGSPVVLPVHKIKYIVQYIEKYIVFKSTLITRQLNAQGESGDTQLLFELWRLFK